MVSDWPSNVKNILIKSNWNKKKIIMNIGFWIPWIEKNKTQAVSNTLEILASIHKSFYTVALDYFLSIFVRISLLLWYFGIYLIISISENKGQGNCWYKWGVLLMKALLMSWWG